MRFAKTEAVRGIVVSCLCASLALAIGCGGGGSQTTTAVNPPPAPTITSGPANPSNSTAAIFTFTDSQSGVTFICSLDNAAFSACSSGISYSSLASGAHTFGVQAKDAAGNISSTATSSWTVSATATTPPPAPTITSQPANPTISATATFTFTDSQNGVTFLCSLDNAAFSACSSGINYTSLGSGAHTFAVQAKDSLGNVSPSATYNWTITANVQPIAVNGGPQAAINLSGIYLNGAFTSVTVCVPGSATSCQTIDGILVDTGSFGLRLLSSTSGGELTLALPATSISGSPLGECTQFADMSFIWGPVKTADIKIAGEQASSVPINVIGDTSFPAVPSSCSTSGPDDDTLKALGANGILGVGTFQQDCGPFCSTGTAPTGFYYQCPASGCVPTLVSLTQQVQNPVGLFAADNNGVIIELPAVTSPQPSVTGSMIFGIGTQANNALGSATVFPLDSNGGFTTTYKNVAFTGSFIDSGSNGLFFLDASTTGLPICTDTSFWYCPASTTAFNVTNQATGGSPHTLSFSVGNFDQLIAGSNAAINGTAGPNPGTFDFGLPFFYGRNVYTSIEGTTAPGGQTPYWAF